MRDATIALQAPPRSTAPALQSANNNNFIPYLKNSKFGEYNDEASILIVKVTHLLFFQYFHKNQSVKKEFNQVHSDQNLYSYEADSLIEIGAWQKETFKSYVNLLKLWRSVENSSLDEKEKLSRWYNMYQSPAWYVALRNLI